MELSIDCGANRNPPDGSGILDLIWCLDCSHGSRLACRTMYVDSKPMDYTDVLKNRSLKFCHATRAIAFPSLSHDHLE